MEELRKNAVKYGLFLGLFVIFSTTLVYAIDINLFTAPWYGIANMLIVIAFGVFSSIQGKKTLGGFISFKDTFIAFFITILIGLVILTAFSILLFNVIDPEAKKIITDNVIKMTVDMMQKFGAKPGDINTVIKDMENTDSFGFFGQLKGLLTNIVIYSIIGLISSLIIRKEHPQSI